jgi:hypothetical protein
LPLNVLDTFVQTPVLQDGWSQSAMGHTTDPCRGRTTSAMRSQPSGRRPESAPLTMRLKRQEGCPNNNRLDGRAVLIDGHYGRAGRGDAALVFGYLLLRGSPRLQPPG